MEEKIKNLVAELEQYNKDYYANGISLCSDEDYDLMKLKLKDYIKLYPEYAHLAQSILQTVGSSVSNSKLKKAKHYQKMLSLESVYDVIGYQKWVNYCNKKLVGGSLSDDITVQPKLDGLSIELIYKDGKFIQAITRGDGLEGEDVTENIKATGDVPLEVFEWSSLTISVIGEVVIHKSDFDKYLSKDFANPRNAAVGSLKQLDSSIIPSRHLKVYVFDYSKIEGYYFNSPNSYKGIIDNLKEKKFRTLPFYFNAKIKEAPKIYKNMTIWRDTYDFEMDGIVFKIDNPYTRKTLGNKTDVPVWAVAWKFNSMLGQSEIEDINWSISKYGTLTPVAKVKEVNIGGVNITNVNLHNYEFAKTLDIKIGDTVNIRRAGDVIPEIVSVETIKRHNKTLTDIKPPLTCPYCGSRTVINGLNITCSNPKGTCLEQVILKLNHFCSKEAMDVDGLSIETLRVLVEKYGVRTAKDLYTFDFHQLNGKNGFGAKKIANLQIALEKSKKCDKARFMYAMGIPDVGRRASKAIVEELEKEGQDRRWYLLNRREVLNLKIPNIGENIAKSLEAWNLKYWCVGTDLYELIKIMDFTSKANSAVNIPLKPLTSGPLLNEKIIFTGTLSNMNKTREQASILVNMLGGITTNNVSKATMIIVGDKPGSKLGKAITKGLKIMDEQEFETICQKHGI